MNILVGKSSWDPARAISVAPASEKWAGHVLANLPTSLDD
jgi:hypothetical protein